MINTSKLDQLLQLWGSFNNCLYCPCCDKCPYSWTGDKDECMKILRKWISTP